GRVSAKTLPLGNASRSLDSAGNLQGASDGSYTTAYSYYAAGAAPAIPALCGGGSPPDQAQALQRVAPHGMAATTYVYDGASRPIARSDGAGTTCTSYTSEGRVASRIDGDGDATSYAYDPAGNTLSVTAADGAVGRSAYDEAGD